MPVPRAVLWLWLLLLLLMVAAGLVTLPAAPALVVRRRLLLPLPAALALMGMVGVAPRDEARVLLPAVLSSCAAAAASAWAAGGGGCCGCRRPMPVWSGMGGVWRCQDTFVQGFCGRVNFKMKKQGRHRRRRVLILMAAGRATPISHPKRAGLRLHLVRIMN